MYLFIFVYLFQIQLNMHDDVRDRFLKDGFLFPVKFLTQDESKCYGEKYKQYVKLYGSVGISVYILNSYSPLKTMREGTLLLKSVYLGKRMLVLNII